MDSEDLVDSVGSVPSADSGDWTTDVLGAPYVARTLRLAPDEEGEVVATLVRRLADRPSGRAVLHLHGFADYFFQVAAADFWVERGYDFYALDLRKYGRSLRPHQTPAYVADLGAYYEELDLAYAEITRDHDHVVLSAHSTGGLTMPLWLHDRRPRVGGVFLNAPWIDMQGDAWTRHGLLRFVHLMGTRRPRWEVPRNRGGAYARSLHRDYAGEWDFDLSLKPLASFPVYAGWIRAVRRAQTRVARGLEVDAPVLMISSTRSGHPTGPEDPALRETDVVLDVERLRRRVARLSRHVTIAQVEGAIHDVTLSPEPARAHVFDELARWLSAYVEQ